MAAASSGGTAASPSGPGIAAGRHRIPVALQRSLGCSGTSSQSRRGLTDGHAILRGGGKSLPIHTVPVNFTEKAHQLPVCRERLTEPANDPQANVRDGGLRAQVEDRVVVPRLVGGACSVCVSCWSSGWSGRARAVSIQLTLSQTVDRRCVSPPRDATAAWLQCVAVSVSCGSCRGGCECSELTFSQTGRYLVCRFNCDGLMG